MTIREKSPAFQFYPKDYLTDAKVVVMTAEERGLYVNLLCHDWLEDGFLPEDMCRLSGYDWHDKHATHRDDWNAIEQVLNRCFAAHPTDPNKISNPRLQVERRRQEENREKKRLAGIKSGKVRKDKYLDKGTPVQLCSNKTRTKTNSSSSSSSSNINKAHEFSEILKPISDGNLKTGLERWIAWRKTEKKKPVTALALKQLLKRYENKSQQLLEDLRYSVSQDWTGVFPERRNMNSPKSDPNKNQSISKRGLEFVNAAIPKNNTTGT